MLQQDFNKTMWNDSSDSYWERTTIASFTCDSPGSGIGHAQDFMSYIIILFIRPVKCTYMYIFLTLCIVSGLAIFQGLLKTFLVLLFSQQCTNSTSLEGVHYILVALAKFEWRFIICWLLRSCGVFNRNTIFELTYRK